MCVRAHEYTCFEVFKNVIKLCNSIFICKLFFDCFVFYVNGIVMIAHYVNVQMVLHSRELWWDESLVDCYIPKNILAEI